MRITLLFDSFSCTLYICYKYFFFFWVVDDDVWYDAEENLPKERYAGQLACAVLNLNFERNNRIMLHLIY